MKIHYKKSDNLLESTGISHEQGLKIEALVSLGLSSEGQYSQMLQDIADSAENEAELAVGAFVLGRASARADAKDIENKSSNSVFWAVMDGLCLLVAFFAAAILTFQIMTLGFRYGLYLGLVMNIAVILSILYRRRSRK